MIGARLLFITWLTKNTFSKRTQFLLLYSLFTIPKNYLFPAKCKVSYMSGKLSMSIFISIVLDILKSSTFVLHSLQAPWNATVSRFPELLPCWKNDPTVSIAGRTITNLRFADDIYGLAGSEQELAKLVEHIDQTSKAYGLEINAEKTTND